MYRCFSGYATTYTASYYRSRLTYYGFLSIMVGLVQLSLGKLMLKLILQHPSALVAHLNM